MTTATTATTWNRYHEVQHELTMAFIGGRRPNNAEMIRVEELREEAARIHSALAYLA